MPRPHRHRLDRSRQPVMHTAFETVASALMWLLLLIAIAVGLLLARLSQGPIALDAASPWIAAQVQAAAPGLSPTIERASITWSSRTARPMLALGGVTLTPKTGEPLSFDELRLHLDRRDLLRGRVLPVAAEIDGLSLAVERYGPGDMRLAVYDPNAALQGGSGPTTKLEDAGLPRPGDGAESPPRRIDMPLRVSALDAILPAEMRKLDAFFLSGAELRLVDRRKNTEWVLPGTSVTLRRDGERVDGEIVARAEPDDPASYIIAKVRYAPAEGVRATVDVKGLHARRIVDLAGAAEALGPADAMINGLVRLQVSEDGLLRDAAFDLTGDVLDTRKTPDPGRGAGSAAVTSAAAGARGEPERGLEVSVPVGETDVALTIAGYAARGTLTAAGQRIALEDATLETSAGTVHVAGRVARQTREGGLGVVDADLTGDAPVLRFDTVFAEPLRAVVLGVEGAIDLDAGRGEGTASIKVAETTVTAEGWAAVAVPAPDAEAGAVRASDGEREPDRDRPGDAPPQWIGAIDGTIDGLTAAKLIALWPLQAAASGRDWLAANLKDGTVDAATFRWRPDGLRLPGGDDRSDDTGPDPDFTLEFDVSDLRMTYAGALSPLSEASGHGRLTDSALTIDVTGGKIGRLTVREGTFRIPELGNEVPDGVIAARLSGPVRALLRELDKPPFGYLSDFGIPPESTGGRFDGRLDLSLPLLKDVRMAAVSLSTRVAGRDLSITGLVEDYIGEDGDIDFAVDKMGLQAEGTVRVNGVPLTVRWEEAFQDASLLSRVDLTGTVSEGDRRLLNLDLEPYVTGDAAVRAIYTRSGSDNHTAALEMDLATGGLSLPEVGWQAGPGTPKTVRASVDLTGGRATLSGLTVLAEGLTIDADEIAFAEGTVTRGRFGRVKIDGLVDAAVSFSRSAADGVEVHARGAMLDVSRLVGRRGSDGIGDGELPKVRIDAALEALRLSDGLVLPNVQIALSSRPQDVRTLTGELRLGNGTRIEAVLRRLDGGRRGFEVFSATAGKLFAALDLYQDMGGGALSVTGEVVPRPNAPTAISGTLEVTNFALKNAPTLANLLTLGSFTGIANRLSGQGIAMDLVEVPFEITGGDVRIGDSLARGPAVGATFAGVVDRVANTIELHGTLVPSYGLNSFLSNIPVVGNVLAGRRGEGVLGINFTVAGDVADPSVSVNPLSVLTPGILRRLIDPRSYADDTGRVPQADERTPVIRRD